VLSGDDVALKIQADVYRFSVPHSGAAPDALVVLFQAANIAEALRLDARLGLTFGEAVSAGDRRPGIISVFAVDGFVVWPVVGGRVLCQRTTRRKYEGNRRKQISCAWSLPSSYPPEATMLHSRASSARSSLAG
jgi:hypothetical protein